MLIMMFVGILIGSWMVSGTVPLMMYYGLKLLPAPIFLVASCLLCCLMSLMTGTSWGTMGTVGVALIGVAEGLEIPVAYAAGSIVVGAIFGDKLAAFGYDNHGSLCLRGGYYRPYQIHAIYDRSVPGYFIDSLCGTGYEIPGRTY